MDEASAARVSAVPAAPKDSAKGEGSKSRLRELDSLRGIAACLVLLYHFSYQNDPQKVWPFRIPWGHFGVELFFVISGFVILMTIERSGRVSEFVISRVTRLYPAYWCALLFTTAVLLLLVPSEVHPVQFVANLTMMQTLVRIPSIDGSYWTLAVEMVFYGWIVVWFRFRDVRRPIEWYCLGWMGVTAAIRAAFLLKHMEMPRLFATPFLLNYSQFFAIGICQYRLYTRQANALTGVTIAAGCLMSLFGGADTSLNPGPVVYLIVTCVVTACVYLASQSRLSLLRNPVLLFFGDISYPLYLIHQRVGEEVSSWTRAHHWPEWVSIPSILALLVTVAWLIHDRVEVPARTVLRGRLQKLLGARRALG
jgi:peptidoglycan/LPS O-acetylase OafA/YrhL